MALRLYNTSNKMYLKSRIVCGELKWLYTDKKNSDTFVEQFKFSIHETNVASVNRQFKTNNIILIDN